jgi:single-stranded DNA-binding protein
VIFFHCAVWEKAASEVLRLGLDRGDRVIIDGVWSKRAWVNQNNERQVANELRVTKVRIFSEVEVAGDEDVTS